MGFVEYSIRIFLTLEAILLALFGLIYNTHINFQKETKEGEDFSFEVYDTGKACRYLQYLIILSNIIILVDIIIYFKNKWTEIGGCSKVGIIITDLFNGIGIVLFAVGISIICIRLGSAIKHKRY